MDAESTKSYKTPCPQCAEVHWGISDEGQYYCKSCHTVIEKTLELEETEVYNKNARAQSINRGLRKAKRKEWGWEWYICEGFQFILLKQAEALEALGIGSGIKEEVMCVLWRKYLQRTAQAYCRRPMRNGQRLVLACDSSVASSELDTDSEICPTDITVDSDFEQRSQSSLGLPSTGEHTDVSDAESMTSVRSGSVDGAAYIQKKKPWERKLNMPMTLAFCYLSLLWVRASVTLSDLLRLVFYRHIPYYNSQENFPETINIYGADLKAFEVKNFPVHRNILEIAHWLGVFLQLPEFPPITETCYYHPNVLCMKYLMEVNLPDMLLLTAPKNIARCYWTGSYVYFDIDESLPNTIVLPDVKLSPGSGMWISVANPKEMKQIYYELHTWTCTVAEKANLDNVEFLTFNPKLKRKRMIPHDIQAVAIIIVTLKLIFGLDDNYEWQLAHLAQGINRENDRGFSIFDFQKWYKTMRPSMDEARKKLEEEQARFYWDSEKVLYYRHKSRARILKRRRLAKNLQNQFIKLAGAAPDAGNQGPSSFVFSWDEQNGDKTCFHGHSLEHIVKKDKKEISRRKGYWLNSVRKCRSRYCQHWRQYDECQYPSSYRFVLSLFSLVLRVEARVIHYEVSLIEDKLYKQVPVRRIKKLTKTKI